MQNWYKNVFVDATVLFQLTLYADLYAKKKRVIWNSNQSYSLLKYVSVLRELPNKLNVYENP